MQNAHTNEHTTVVSFKWLNLTKNKLMYFLFYFMPNEPLNCGGVLLRVALVLKVVSYNSTISSITLVLFAYLIIHKWKIIWINTYAYILFISVSLN